MDLNPVARKTFVLGYWIGSKYTGHGYVTAACQALMDYAQRALDATEFWAGIKPARRKSAGVAERLGFSVLVQLMPPRFSDRARAFLTGTATNSSYMRIRTGPTFTTATSTRESLPGGAPPWPDQVWYPMIVDMAGPARRVRFCPRSCRGN